MPVLFPQLQDRRQPGGYPETGIWEVAEGLGDQFDVIFRRWTSVDLALAAAVAVVEVRRCLSSSKAEGCQS